MFDSLSERLRKTLARPDRPRPRHARPTSTPRCARSASRCSRPTSTSRSSRTSSPGSARRRVGAEVLQSLNAGQQVVKIVHDELVELLVGGRPDVPPPGQPGGHRARRPPGLGQDDVGREARAAPRQAGPPAAARRRRPVPARRPPTSWRRSAEPLDIPVHRAPPGTPVVDIARGGARRRQPPGPRRRHPRHRRPPHDRRGADGARSPPSTRRSSRSRRCSSSTR